MQHKNFQEQKSSKFAPKNLSFNSLFHYVSEIILQMNLKNIALNSMLNHLTVIFIIKCTFGMIILLLAKVKSVVLTIN